MQVLLHLILIQKLNKKLNIFTSFLNFEVEIELWFSVYYVISSTSSSSFSNQKVSNLSQAWATRWCLASAIKFTSWPPFIAEVNSCIREWLAGMGGEEFQIVLIT